MDNHTYAQRSLDPDRRARRRGAATTADSALDLALAATSPRWSRRCAPGNRPGACPPTTAPLRRLTASTAPRCSRSPRSQTRPSRRRLSPWRATPRTRGDRRRLLGAGDRSPRPHLRGTAIAAPFGRRPRLRLRPEAAIATSLRRRRSPTVRGRRSLLAHQRGRPQGRRRLLHPHRACPPPRPALGAARFRPIISPRSASWPTSDPAAAADQLFDFAVIDPACGSAHFLVEVVDELADQLATLLGDLAAARVARRARLAAGRGRQGSSASGSRTPPCSSGWC